jgi:metallophosphoesterase (TIGR00282 family)
VKILFVGDIVGRPGRDLVLRTLRPLVARERIDLVVANAENDALLKAGVEVMTSGNHIWDKKEVYEYIEQEPRLIRPANFPSGAPGRGRVVVTSSGGVRVGVVNVMGRVFMTPLDNPFEVVLREIEAVKRDARIVLVDMHAEATSEKVAMGWHLAGKVTAVVGTHTHVQTADARVLPGGTAYITDLGMTGPHDSIIGVAVPAALARFVTGMPHRFETATENPRLQAVTIAVDETTGKATAIDRIDLSAADCEALRAAEKLAP